ncbi:hypothetical protein [Burkholderia sp. JKS000303]|uniref:hypothetical protein n=1 Tax=Burkholderia sp. JKS000303 TaxID=1938747 RepID=UPI000C0053FE|nr:hypothetical protein [Burkholderia sp. JKS000303]PFH19336.1 hypothetical protein BX604_5933 [Burkholderia sp. JKS000303]
MKLHAAAGAILLVGIFASGCSTDGEVSRKWSSNMRELGIYPIFPPSADYRVGDVRTLPLCEFDDRKSKYPGIGLLTGSLEPFLLDTSTSGSGPELSQRLTQRNVNHAALPDYPQPVAGASGVSATYVAATAPRAGSKELPLAQVAFPGFVNVTAHGGEISALLPIGNFPLPMGTTFSRNASANVNISVADSYSMPASSLLKLFEARKADILLSQLFYGSDAYEGRPCNGKLVVTLINEVFYGRVFDVTLNEEAAVALSGAAKRAVLHSAELPIAATTATAASGPQATSDAIVAARDAAASAASGIAANLWSGAATSIALRRTYQQPIAVGYRGVRLIYEWKGTEARIVGSVESNSRNSAHPAGASSGTRPAPKENGNGPASGGAP